MGGKNLQKKKNTEFGVNCEKQLALLFIIRRYLI